MKARKKSMLMLGLVLAMLLAVLGGVVLLARHEPDFYRHAEIPTGDERNQLAAQFAVNVKNMIDCFKDQDKDPTFEESFEAKGLNSVFHHEIWHGMDEAKELARRGISDLRVSFEKDLLRLGFRYRNGFMTTIISVDMHIWRVPTEVNTFAIEILKRRAGSLPFPTQALLEEISNIARKHNIEVSWYRHNGHPVALVRVQTDGPRPNAKFSKFDQEPGRITVGIEPTAGSGQAQNRPSQPPALDHKALEMQASPTPE